MIDTKAPTRALTGLLFTGIGAAALWLTRPAAASGDTAQSSLFPRAIGVCLLLTGLAIAIRDLTRNAQPVPEWRIRASLAVIGSVVVFSAVIEYLGLLPAVFASVLLAAFGSGDARLGPSIVLGLYVALAMALVFVGLLGQPIKLLGGF